MFRPSEAIERVIDSLILLLVRLFGSMLRVEDAPEWAAGALERDATLTLFDPHITELSNAR
jgi:hypothetical protein